MKNVLKVTILFCLIISLFIIPSFADDPYFCIPYVTNNNTSNYAYCFSADNAYYTNNIRRFNLYLGVLSDVEAFYCCLTTNGDAYYFTSETARFRVIAEYTDTGYNYFTNEHDCNTPLTGGGYYTITNVPNYWRNYTYNAPVFNTAAECLEYGRNALDNQISYSKNPNVDEFIANTMISMGVKFDTPAYALSYASAAWDWCIDEDNMESANPFDEWNIDSFVSYCNAQSNNYLNWYNGYKVSEDVTNALGEYIRQNIRSLTGLPAGVTSVTGAYLPIYHYGSGFQSGVSSPTAQTFYPAQTITYFNGEYVNETNDISTSQFLYTPADVRRFLGYPGSSPAITPSSPTGTGTITDDPNNPDQKNITINFPALDWLADAIKSILDFLRDAFTTLANLLTQLLDAILGLFSDAFAGLADFGQGIIDFMQSVFAGLSTLLNGYVPSDLAVIIACFIALNFGIGLITFVLKGH